MNRLLLAVILALVPVSSVSLMQAQEEPIIIFPPPPEQCLPACPTPPGIPCPQAGPPWC